MNPFALPSFGWRFGHGFGCDQRLAGVTQGKNFQACSGVNLFEREGQPHSHKNRSTESIAGFMLLKVADNVHGTSGERMSSCL